MPALDTLLTEVEKTLLVLAQPVVVLIERRVEDSRNPVLHCQKRLAGRRCYRDRVVVRSIAGRIAAEIVFSERIIQLVERHSMRRGEVLWGHTDDHSPRANHVVSGRILLVGPSSHRRRGHEPIPGGREGCGIIRAQGDSDDIGRVRFQHNSPALARQHNLRIRAPDRPALEQENRQNDRNEASTNENF